MTYVTGGEAGRQGLEHAYLIARGPNPLASICGRICGAPCEAACRRGSIPDGSHVQVIGSERFGPLPFLFRTSKQYSAEIHAGGLSSTYYMPLLGAHWTCNYHVLPDRKHVDALLQCPWAEAREQIHRGGG